MNQEEWIKDPMLTQIPREKILFLGALLQASRSLTQKEMLPFLIAFEKRRKENNISFTQSELNCMIQVLQKYAAPEDLKMIELFKTLNIR